MYTYHRPPHTHTQLLCLKKKKEKEKGKRKRKEKRWYHFGLERLHQCLLCALPVSAASASCESYLAMWIPKSYPRPIEPEVLGVGPSLLLTNLLVILMHSSLRPTASDKSRSHPNSPLTEVNVRGSLWGQSLHPPTSASKILSPALFFFHLPHPGLQKRALDHLGYLSLWRGISKQQVLPGPTLSQGFFSPKSKARKIFSKTNHISLFPQIIPSFRCLKKSSIVMWLLFPETNAYRG